MSSRMQDIFSRFLLEKAISFIYIVVSILYKLYKREVSSTVPGMLIMKELYNTQKNILIHIGETTEKMFSDHNFLHKLSRHLLDEEN